MPLWKQPAEAGHRANRSPDVSNGRGPQAASTAGRTARGFDAYRYVLGAQGERRALRALPRLFGASLALARHAGPRLLTLVVAAQVAGALLLAAQVVLGKVAIETVLEQSRPGGSFGPVVLPLAALALATAASGLIGAATVHLQRLLAERVQKVSMGTILDVTTAVDLLEFERPEFFDHLQRARVNALTRPLTMVTGVVGVISGVLAVAGLSVALVLVEPLLLGILLGAGLPLAWLARRSGRAEYEFALRETPERRLRAYLEAVLSDRDEAKEVRAFQIADHLHARWEDSYAGYFARLGRHVRRRVRLAVAGAAVSALAMGAAFGLITWLIVERRLTLATAGAGLIAIRLLGARLQGLFTGVTGLFESSLFIRDLESFPARTRPAGPRARASAGALVELRAERVSFRYPGAERDALRDVSIRVRAGETVALVGPNGSGKTTVAKLLSQMFAPSAGRVLWNDVDARTLDAASMRAQIGVIFQDFVRYQLSARENVGLGRSEALGDAERLVGAARRGGAHADLEGLPDGYDTLLGKEFAGGHELSGGQWQRVALARAFFRDAALLVLDEPTASLDARAEHEVFERVRELAAGRSLLLISHRFSTVRSADRIYVLEGGFVVEEGSHDALMRQDGRYAEMFGLQARAYLD